MPALLDTSWIKQSFLLDESQIDDDHYYRRYYSSAVQKYTDTTMGGHWALNPLPQFTRYCDPPVKGRFGPSTGQGEYYSEAIDDNAQIVHFRLGVPKFNSLTSFFGNFYSAEASSFARTGRSSTVFFKFGSVLGTLVTLPVQPLVWLGSTIDYFTNRPQTSYYVLEPRMPMYWSAFNTMLNGVVANLGWVARFWTEEASSQFVPGMDRSQDVEDLSSMLGGDVMMSKGTINVTAIAGRAQRLADKYNESIAREIGAARDAKTLQEAIRKVSTVDLIDDTEDVSLTKYLTEYFNKASAHSTFDPNKIDQMNKTDNSEESLAGWGNFFRAERRMGLEFVSYRVDHTGVQTETFTTTTKESSISATINGISGEVREKRFSLMDGNTGIGVVDWAIDSARQMAMGAASQFKIDGLAALAGSAFVDIPKLPDQSSADINRTTFTIPLRSPYGHDYARIQHILLPLCGLLCMGLPISTGPQSYTSPMLIEVINAGRTRIHRGVVSSISVSRGVGDTGWLQGGKFMGVDVTITIDELSSVMHMPLAASYSMLGGLATAAASGLSVAGSTITNAVGLTDVSVEDAAFAGATAAQLANKDMYSEDSLLTTYMSLLGSVPFEAEVNPLRKLKLRATMRAAQWNQKLSKAHVANTVMSWWPGELVRAVTQATNRGD